MEQNTIVAQKQGQQGRIHDKRGRVDKGLDAD